MLFLLDSNIAITSDPLTTELEPGVGLAMHFHRLATTNHHDLRVHPSSLHDFERIADPALRQARLQVFERYQMLASPPTISALQRDELGSPVAYSNEAVDQDLLAAVVGNAVDYLVTEDGGIHRKARRMDVADRVLLTADAVALLHGLHEPLPKPPPAVRRVKTHELRYEDSIFDGLRDDYPDFEGWFRRASRSQRDALVIDGDENHAAVCIFKTEPTGEFGLPGPMLKLCTFKVAEGNSGQKYGELMLKTVFDQAHTQRVRGIYVTAFEKHVTLISLLTDFGFAPLAATTSLGEQILEKPTVATDEGDSLDNLAFHIRFGPPTMRLENAQAYFVPIEPRWHRALFPDAEPDDGLFSAIDALSNRPFGNALRKAYLCHSPSRRLRPGDVLLFYRSHDEKAVFVAGVVEETLVSSDALEVAALVGRRTVYTYEQIEAMVKRGPVLAIMFRQGRILRDDPITLDDLQRERLVTSWPQSIARIRPEGMPWLRQRLAE